MLPSSRLRIAFATLFLCVGFGATSLFAQDTGSISGVVVDQANGESLPGANVSIASTTTGTATDLNGRYTLKDLAPGAYEVVFSFVGFQKKTITGVEVTAGETTELNVTLGEQTAKLDEVIVEAEASRSSEAGLLKERARAASVSNAIGAEEISRAGAGNMADAMSKVTGASIVEGKYVNVRGLQGRYVQAQLNGSSLPSTDPDGESVALDLFPANLVENVVTSKSFTPDKPGNFTGGAVNVSTKSFPSSFFLEASASSSYNSAVGLGGTVLQPTGGLSSVPTAASNGVPSLSAAFTDEQAAQQLDQVTQAFGSQIAPVTSDAIANRSAEVSFGNQFSVLDDRAIGVIASASYDKSYSGYSDGVTARFEQTATDVEELQATARFDETSKGTQTTQYGGLFGLSFQPNPKNEVGVQVLYNANNEESARFDSGLLPRDQLPGTFQTRTLQTIERSIMSGELRGSHQIGEGKRPLRIEWKSSLSEANRDEPDFRVFSNNVEATDSDTTYSIVRSVYNPAVARYFRNLDEQIWANNLSVEFPLSTATVKVGGTYNYKERTYREQRFDHVEDVTSEARYAGSPNGYINDQAGLIGQQNGLYRFGTYIEDQFQPNNNYDADQTIGAGFAMVDFPIPGVPGVKFIGGARAEYTQQSIITLKDTRGDFEQLDILPSANVVWTLKDNMNVRGAYGRTIARPTFREFTPAETFDFIGDYVVQGNPELNRTLVDNFDLRWEWFVRPGEVLSVSAYYKHLDDPIERTIDPSRSANVTVTYENKETAEVYGLEVEARKRLDFVHPALQYVQIGGNLTLTQSAVTRDSLELVAIGAYRDNPSDTRQLQGQSPYIVNLNAGYENPEIGTSINVFYNRFGDRIDTVTRNGVDLEEQGRNIIDVMASQRLFDGLTLKASVKNVLDENEVIAQDFKGQQFVNDLRPLGRSISMGVSYSF
ncbi:TonB-dependent receptor [Longibacter salinarum]|nr:TonB-dependent receptor [Longibacter salinarum]